MNIFFKEHLDLLERLINTGVKFIIVGGFAVNYHGYNRTTGDLDIWIQPDNSNRDKLLDVLHEMGFTTEGIEMLKLSDFEQPFVFNFWERPYKVDFLTQISGVSFNEAFNKKDIENINGLPIPFLDFQNLILSKMATRRLRDQADVEELQKVNKLRKKKENK